MRLAPLWLVAVAAALAPAAAVAARPDLVVQTKGPTPENARTLGGFDTRVLIRNAGGRRAPRTQVGFVLSRDKRRSKRDFELAGDLSVPRLKPDRKATPRGRVVIPSDVPTGDWRLVACVDPDKKLEEAAEGNNCAATAKFRVAGPDPLRVSYAKDQERAATQNVETSSAIYAEAADGTQYMLELGSSAADLAAVRMTPIHSIAPTPRNVTPVAGVLIEPAGRLLQGSDAYLTIAPPSGAPAARLMGFGFAADGSDFHLERATGDGYAVTVPIDELGVHGFGYVPAGLASGARAHAAAGSTSPADLHVPQAARNRLAQRIAATQDEEDLVTALCDYKRAQVDPRLELIARTGSRVQAAELIQEAVGLTRQALLLNVDLPCDDGDQELYIRIMRRFFEEVIARCEKGGDDRIANIAEGQRILKQGWLLGLAAEGDAEWLGHGVFDRFAAACDNAWSASYTNKYATRTDSGWSSIGSVSTTARFKIGGLNSEAVQMDVPAPSATWKGDCNGTFRGDLSSAEFQIRGGAITEDRWVGGYVGGRYRPDAKLVTDAKLRVVTSSRVDAMFTIDCQGGTGEWDLAADQESAAAVLPSAGGTTTILQESVDWNSPPGACVECHRVEASLGVVAAPGG